MEIEIETETETESIGGDVRTITYGELLDEFYQFNEDREPCLCRCDPTVKGYPVWPLDHVWVAIYAGNYWAKIIKGEKDNPHKAFLFYEKIGTPRIQIATSTISFFFFSQPRLVSALTDLLYDKGWMQSDKLSETEIEIQ